MYMEIPGAVTVQGRRKEIDSVVSRVYASGAPFDIGVNQPDAATQPGQVTVPWGIAPASGMVPVQGFLGGNSPLQPFSLNTGDIFADVFDQLGLPLNILALLPWVRLQDDVEP
jgi:hypothetical protein